MKKILLLLASLLFLTGCENASASITNKDEAVVTMGDQTLSRQDVYQFMVSNNGGYAAITNAQELILQAEAPVTDEMVANAQLNLESYQQMLGEGLESYLISMGIPSVEAFSEQLILDEQTTVLNSKYVEENYDSIASRFAPKQYQIMQFDNVEIADVALTAVNNGEDFTDVATSNNSAVNSAPQLATSQSQLDTNVLYELESLELGSTSSVITNTDNTLFYIVKLLENDPTVLKEALIEEINYTGATVQEALVHYFGEYQFTVYDIDVFNQIETNYSSYLNQ